MDARKRRSEAEGRESHQREPAPQESGPTPPESPQDSPACGDRRERDRGVLADLS